MDIHKAIGYLPRPKKGWVLPGHKYTGPYNPLHEQLDENDLPIVGQEPFNNKVDEISVMIYVIAITQQERRDVMT